MDYKFVTKYISNWIKNYCLNNDIHCLIVGISGGIDSALTSTLCAETKIKTIVVSMPIHQNKKQLILAKDHIKWLKKYKNVEDLTIQLSDVYDIFSKQFPKDLQNKLGFANSKARLRMTTLYQIAASKMGLLLEQEIK